MNHKEVIAIIVEGAKRETGIIDNIAKCYFQNKQIVILDLPVEMNIYMLYKEIAENNDEVDLIEIIREASPISKEKLKKYNRDQFSEIYLFFDYDYHQNNVANNCSLNGNQILKEMLSLFNDETNQGKLYISYPMCEAIRDFLPMGCRTYSGNCYIGIDNLKNYKNISGDRNKLGHIKKYTIDEWNMAINCFRRRISCLKNLSQALSIQDCKDISQFDIFNMQEMLLNKQGSFLIISAFPKFIIDYFKINDLETKHIS